MKTFLSVVTAISILLVSGLCIADEGNDLKSEANRFFLDQNWEKAKTAYESVVQQEPANGQAWLRLGLTCFALQTYEQALDAMNHAEMAGFAVPFVQFQKARILAKLNRSDDSMAMLEKAAGNGFAQLGTLESDPLFEPMRDTDRYRKVYLQMEQSVHPCKFGDEYRNFDFWLGEWNVEAQGRQAGTSKVELILDECVIFENWTGASGYNGKSFNLYNSALEKWQQLWVDNSGTVLIFTGEFKDGNLEYYGETPQGNGTTVLQKLFFYPMPDGRVRQLWQQSTDGGKNWSVAFDGMYSKRK